MKKQTIKIRKESRKEGVVNAPATIDQAKTALPTVFDPAKYAGAGHEEAGPEAYIIPRLVILQTNSPQCLEGDPAYAKGAKAGSFYNTATKTAYDGKEGVRVIMCHFQRRALEWIPRDKGGGFRGEYPIEKFDVELKKQVEFGRLLLENGNSAVDTRYHFLFHLTKNGPEKVLMGLSSTQIRSSKEWMTALRTYRVTDDKGRSMVAPSFMFICKLTTVDKSNEKGKWKLLNFEIERLLNTKDGKENNLLYEAAGFHDQVKGGFVKPKYEEEDNPNSEDDAPF